LQESSLLPSLATDIIAARSGVGGGAVVGAEAVGDWAVHRLHEALRIAWTSACSDTKCVRTSELKPRAQRSAAGRSLSGWVEGMPDWYDEVCGSAHRRLVEAETRGGRRARRARLAYRRLTRQRRDFQRQWIQEERSWGRWHDKFARSPAEAWRSLNKLRGKSAQACKRSAAEQAAHFKQAGQASGSYDPDTMDSAVSFVDALRDGRVVERSMPVLDEAFKLDEVVEAIKAMADGSGGLDGVPIWMLKSAASVLAPLLALLFDLIRGGKCVIKDWCINIVVAVPKKGARPYDLDTFRGVHLASVIASSTRQ